MGRSRRLPLVPDSIAFQCQEGCGDCCSNEGGIVYVSREDAALLATHHGLAVPAWLEVHAKRASDGRWVLGWREDGACRYLEGASRCTVYEARPVQCRAFPWWAENLRSERAWNKVVRSCPGLRDPTAPEVDKGTIESWMQRDLESQRGFRSW